MMTATTLTPAKPHTAAARGGRIVDAPMRMFHWLFALSFTGAYLTAEGEAWRALHVTLGYTMLGLLVFRIGYGLFGPAQARLGPLWRKLTALPQWLRATLANPLGASWRQGQHLAMALAVAALLALTLPLAASGIATFHEWGEALWGDALAELHEALGEGLLIVVLVHVGLIALLSLLRRHNAAAPMLSGRSPVPGGRDVVKANRGWLAALLLAAVLGWLAWDWQQTPNGLIQPAQMAAGDHDADDD